jgi:putative transposase
MKLFNSNGRDFLATLECELLKTVQKFREPKDGEIALFKYIEGFYNTLRQHSRLNHLSSVHFKETLAS